jgi:hypothetical protein
MNEEPPTIRHVMLIHLMVLPYMLSNARLINYLTKNYIGIGEVSHENIIAVSIYNGLTQVIHVELLQRRHMVYVEIDIEEPFTIHS